MDEELLTICENLLYFICSSLPQPIPSDESMNQFSLISMKPQMIRYAKMKCKTVPQFLQYVGLKRPYEESILHFIMKINSFSDEDFVFYERFAIQITEAYILSASLGKTPPYTDLLLQLLLKMMTPRNQQIYLIAISVLIPFSCKDFHINSFITFSRTLYQKCYLEQNNYPPIYSTMHQILDVLITSERRHIVRESETVRFFNTITKVYQSLPIGYPHNETLYLFQVVQPLLLEMNIYALTFFNSIFNYLQNEFIAVFLQKFAEALVIYLINDIPAYTMSQHNTENDFFKDNQVEFNTSNNTEKFCFESKTMSNGLNYTIPNDSFFHQFTFFEVIENISSILNNSEDVFNVFLTEYCSLADNFTDNPSCINLMITYSYIVHKSIFDVHSVLYCLFNSQIITQEGREPIFYLIYFSIFKVLTNADKKFTNAISESPLLVSEISKCFSEQEQQKTEFEFKLYRVDYFCDCGMKCINSLQLNQNVFNTWVELLNLLITCFSKTKDLSIFMNNKKYAIFLFVSLYDRSYRNQILHYLKYNMNSIVLLAFSSFFNMLNFNTQSSMEIINDIALTLFDFKSQSTVNVPEYCIHYLLNQIKQMLSNKKMDEKMLFDLRDCLLQIDDKKPFFNEVVSLLFKDYPNNYAFKYPSMIFLFYSAFNELEIINKSIDIEDNCKKSTLCKFDYFLTQKLSENLDLFQIYKKITKISCSKDSCKNYFHLLTTYKNDKFHEIAFQTFYDLMVEETPLFGATIDIGTDVYLPGDFRKLTHYYIASFVYLNDDEFARLFSLCDNNGESISVSIAEGSVIVNSALITDENIQKGKWFSIVLECNQEDIIVYINSRRVGKGKANNTNILGQKAITIKNSNKTYNQSNYKSIDDNSNIEDSETLEVSESKFHHLIIGRSPGSKTKTYNANIYTDLKFPIKGFSFDGVPLVDLKLITTIPENQLNFSQQFRQCFHSEYLLTLLLPKEKYYMSKGVDPFKAVEIFVNYLKTNEEEQEYFVNSKCPQILSYILSLLPQKEKSYDIVKILAELIDHTNNQEFANIIYYKILSNLSLLLPMQSDNHIKSLELLLHIFNTKKLLYENGFSQINRLAILTIYYNYHIGLNSVRDPFLDIEKCREIICQGIITASKKEFSVENFVAFVEFILYTDDFHLKIGLLTTLVNSVKESSLILDPTVYPKAFSKLFMLFQMNNSQISCYVAEIVLIFYRKSNGHKNNFIIPLEKHILAAAPSKELDEGLKKMMIDGDYHELFELCSMIAVNKKDDEFFNITIRNYGNDPSWCIWTCIGMLRGDSDSCLYFLSRTPQSQWENIINCILILCYTYNLDEREPILRLLNLLIDNITIENANLILFMCQHFIFFGQTNVVNDALWREFNSSPFIKEIHNEVKRKSELFQINTDLTNLYFDNEDLRMILSSRPIHKELTFNIRINYDGSWADEILCKKAIQAILKYKITKFINFAFVTDYFLAHVDPRFSFAWLKKALNLFKAHERNPEIIYYSQRINIITTRSMKPKFRFDDDMFITSPLEPGSFTNSAQHFQDEIKKEGERISMLTAQSRETDINEAIRSVENQLKTTKKQIEWQYEQCRNAFEEFCADEKNANFILQLQNE